MPEFSSHIYDSFSSELINLHKKTCPGNSTYQYTKHSRSIVLEHLVTSHSSWPGSRCASLADK